MSRFFRRQPSNNHFPMGQIRQTKLPNQKAVDDNHLERYYFDQIKHLAKKDGFDHALDVKVFRGDNYSDGRIREKKNWSKVKKPKIRNGLEDDEPTGCQLKLLLCCLSMH